MKRPNSVCEKMVRAHNRLFAKDWSVADPESAALSEAMHAMRHEPERLTREQQWLILAAADAWVHFGAYGTGPWHFATSSVIGQLRQVRKTILSENEAVK